SVCNLHFADGEDGEKTEIGDDDALTAWEAGEGKLAAGHTFGAAAGGQAATCQVDGWKDYYTCSVCNLHFADGEDGEKTEIGDADALAAWKTGAGKIAAGHNVVKTEERAATCTTSGNIAYWHCADCDKYFKDEALTEEVTLAGTRIEAKGHQGIAHAAKEATATEAGNIPYWTCSSCGKYFRDAACKQEITQAQTVLQALGEPLTKTESFISRLYDECLSRNADAEGMEYWDTALESKQMTGAQVARAFVFSKEYSQSNTSDEEFVDMLYHTFMNREADTEGKAYWMGCLNQGLSREYVFQKFAMSQEFGDICKASDIEQGTVALTQARDKNPGLTGFVNRIYGKALERSGEEDGLNFWCQSVQDGAKTPVQVAEYFMNSEEFTNKQLTHVEFVKVLYRTFMDREYDEEGLNYWVNELAKGQSRSTVIRRFAGCQEFKDIMESFGL
ncbi:MAG: DUF4214 domain-containing protein, partial [Bacteroides sp.]|nr:DUF4214 domain-containing protein [Bacteroides sp.]MCM1548499.1 DUF4214 domain-containing protein [Clostridium sp.]